MKTGGNEERELPGLPRKELFDVKKTLFDLFPSYCKGAEKFRLCGYVSKPLARHARLNEQLEEVKLRPYGYIPDI